MRKAVFVVLGLLELAVAVVLVVFGSQLPRDAEVGDTFGKAERVTRNSSTQVQLVRRHLHDLRRPELPKEMRATGTPPRQSIDFEMIGATKDALGDLAAGLDGLAQMLDPDTVAKLSEGLGATASYLDE